MNDIFYYITLLEEGYLPCPVMLKFHSQEKALEIMELNIKRGRHGYMSTISKTNGLIESREF